MCWQGKALHGQFLQKIKGKLDKEHLAMAYTCNIKSKPKGLILTTQEQVIQANTTKPELKKIIK